MSHHSGGSGAVAEAAPNGSIHELLTSRPEIELLLLCVSPVRDEQRSARIRQLLNRLTDWNFLEELAESHRLLPLLYWELNAAGSDGIPTSIADKFQHNTRTCLLLASELFRILDLFEREGISAIPFKGPTLAAYAYNNLALRSFIDLDIFVRSEDVWRVRDVLLREGYTIKLRLNQRRENAYLHSYDELVLHGPNESSLVELHWAFLPTYFSAPLKTSKLWERTVQVTLGNRSVRSLSPEDLFLVLCLHGAKHCWSHLGLVCDVAWLISANRLPWDALLGRARELGVHRMVLLASVLAFEVLKVPLAEPVTRDLLDDPEVPVLAGKIVQALFGVRHDESAILRTASLHMRMRERPMDRARYFFRLGTRPGLEDWQMVNLPRPLSFLYRVLRFPRLAFKYWLRVLRAPPS
jgi:hypothetical protein